MTEYEPDGVPPVSVTVRTDLGMFWKKSLLKVIELGFSDVPSVVGSPETARFTVPVNPFRAPTLTVDWFEVALGTMRVVWAGDT